MIHTHALTLTLTTYTHTHTHTHVYIVYVYTVLYYLAPSFFFLLTVNRPCTIHLLHSVLKLREGGKEWERYGLPAVRHTSLNPTSIGHVCCYGYCCYSSFMCSYFDV